LDEVRFKEYIYSLLQRTARSGVSLFMTQEIAELFGVTKLSEYGISHLSRQRRPVAVPSESRGSNERSRAEDACQRA
jgi:hypothetical protein